MKTYTKLFASISGIGEFELSYTPYEYPEPIAKVSEDKVVIGYLVHDDSPQNPMTDFDGQGELITDSQGVITDGNPWHHLGCESSPYRGDLYRDFDQTGVYELAVELMTPQLLEDEDFLEYCIHEFENDNGCTDKESYLKECIQEIDWGKYGTNIPLWLEMVWNNHQEKAWDQLYAEGKIGTYLAVPVNYCSSNHGPGTASADTCSIERANGVWVPDQSCIENIKGNCWPEGVKIHWEGACGSETDPLHAVVTFNDEVVLDTPKWKDAQAYVDANYPPATFSDLYRSAEKYADSVLEEYIKWCNGEVYGVVVETFKDGEQVEEDACWGYIGHEYAEQTLKEQME